MNLDLSHVYWRYPAAQGNSLKREAALEGALNDIAIDLFLRKAYELGLFEDGELIFKGGTALRKFHFGHKFRMSTDLDFASTKDSQELMMLETDNIDIGPFSVSWDERRRHHSIRFECALYPEKFSEIKVDFSERGLWLPPENLKLLASPVHNDLGQNIEAPIPCQDLRETIAEKLCRFQRRPLIRDLHDLCSIDISSFDMKLIAEMWVLKNYRAMNPTAGLRGMPPRGEGPTHRNAFRPSTMQRPDQFEIERLTYPYIVTDTEKMSRVRSWLSKFVSRYSICDEIVNADAELAEFADDRGQLGWEAQQRITRLISKLTHETGLGQHSVVPAQDNPPLNRETNDDGIGLGF